MSRRRLFPLAMAVVPSLSVVVAVACSPSNGEPVPNPVYDASLLDVGSRPLPPDPEDAGTADAARDAAVALDAGSDARVLDGVVRIHELYVDQIGDGDVAEFVELRALPGTPVDDLTLRLVHASGLVAYEVAAGLPGAVVGSSGLWVVGGTRTDKLNVQERVDRVVSASMWGLGVPGAVQLVRGNTLLDVVGYTDTPDGGSAVPPPASPPTATVEGAPAAVGDNSAATSTTKRRSIGRRSLADGGVVDTQDNRADFCVMEASPGYPQKPCL